MKKLIPFLALFALAALPFVAAAITTTPTSYWNLDEAGTGSRSDSVGGVTLTSNNSVPSSAGKISNAAGSMNGSSQYLSASPTYSNGSGPFCVSFWFNTTTTAADSMLSLSANGTRNFMQLFIGSPTAGLVNMENAFVNGGNQGISGNSAGTYNNGAWHHVVARFQNSASKAMGQVWVDNVKVIDVTHASLGYSAANFVRVRIGSDYNWSTGASGSFYAGSIDEVAYFNNYYCTDQDIADLYNAGAGITYPWPVAANSIISNLIFFQ